MIKHKLALSLAIASLVSMTAVIAADPVLDTWQPGVYFKADFGGQARKNDYHFGAQMALTEQAVNRIYGGNTLLSAARAIKGDKTGELPAYLKLDYDSGKSLTTQWMGSDMFRYDYTTDILSSPALGFAEFSAADILAMTITGAAIGAVGLGYGISSLTSSNPASGIAPGSVPFGGACTADVDCAGVGTFCDKFTGKCND